MSIDLESWVHMDLSTNCDSSARKKLDDGYILQSTKEILRYLKRNNVRTTFFVVSEIFEWYPELIHNISAEGHEVAFHTFSHRRIINSQVLCEEIKKSRRFLDEFEPRGFRAPEMAIQKESIKILRDHGFDYDSSIYGDFSLARDISGIFEIPVSSFSLFRNNIETIFPRNLSLNLVLGEIPFGSGYFIGLLGRAVSFFIDHTNYQGKPAILFIHPWQITVPTKKEVTCTLKKIPYLLNRRKTFQTLLKQYKFTTLEELCHSLRPFEKPKGH